MEIYPILDEHLPEALYVQLYNYFKREIESASLPACSRVPSIRFLADRLHISCTTVQTAYQQLLAEGYLTSRPRSGYYIAELDSRAFAAAPSTHHPDRPIDKKAQFACDFFISAIDTAHFPLTQWKKCADRWLTPSIFNYGDPQGEPHLRELLASYLHRSRGVNCRPEQVVIAAGTESILRLIYQLIEWKNGVLGMEDPGYRGVRRSLRDQNIHLLPIPLDKEGLSIRELEKTAADAVYITPSHQFPLGMIMPVSRRLQILSWAHNRHSWIIEDDYDGEFRYRGKPIPSMQGMDRYQRVIYMGTFSKALTPAIRVAYMVLPLPLLDRYHRLEWRQTASRLHQQTLAQFIESGQWEKHIRRMRTHYRKKQELLLESIKSIMGRHVTVSGQAAGLHIVLYVNSTVPADKLAAMARASGIRVQSTSGYLIQRDSMQKLPLLLGFGGLSTEEAKQGIKQLNEIWSPYYR